MTLGGGLITSSETQTHGEGQDPGVLLSFTYSLNNFYNHLSLDYSMCTYVIIARAY